MSVARPSPLADAAQSEEHAARRAEAYVRSTPGPRVPTIQCVWSDSLEFCNGAASTSRAATPLAPVAILLQTGRGFEATFLTCVHELDHARQENAGRAYTVAQLEASAEAAVAQARGERWRW